MRKTEAMTIRLGLTGGIGAGKSYVAERLRKVFGIAVYDCDAEAKHLNEESAVIRQGLTQLLSDKVYDQQGNLQRQVLADYLFASPANAEKVNAIIHPVVANDFEEWVQRHCSERMVAMESAILFESGFNRLVDKVICVTAPAELRIARATRRDATSAANIERRMKSQMSDTERSQRSDYSLVNDGRDIDSQLTLILSKIKENN